MKAVSLLYYKTGILLRSQEVMQRKKMVSPILFKIKERTSDEQLSAFYLQLLKILMFL